MITTKVEGLKELNAALSKMKERVGRRLLTASLKVGGRVIEKQAEALAPKRKGILEKAIATSRGRPPPPYDAQAMVSVKRLSKKNIRAFKQSQGIKGAIKKARGKRVVSPDDPFYWWWVEFGTSRMPAKPFLRPAFEQKRTEAVNKIKIDLRKRIDKEATKIAKKAVKKPRV